MRALIKEVRLDLHTNHLPRKCIEDRETRGQRKLGRTKSCLANVDESSTPTRARKETLQCAGLDRSKIQFDANANAVSFKQKLEDVFPKLYGGFELLRRGASGNGLVVIRQPVVILQSTCEIRPV